MTAIEHDHYNDGVADAAKDAARGGIGLLTAMATLIKHAPLKALRRYDAGYLDEALWVLSLQEAHGLLLKRECSVQRCDFDRWGQCWEHGTRLMVR